MSSSGSAIGSFDLYDFFAILLPGTLLLLGLYPLIPAEIDALSVAGLFVTVGGGFVFGRATHSEAVSLQEFLDAPSHRERFIQEIISPQLLSEDAVDRFHSQCEMMFPNIGLHDERDYDQGAESYQTLETLYTCVRSYVHMDSRGVSRKFQSIYGFHRSVRWVVIVLGVVYFLYFWLIKFINGYQIETISYTPKIATVGIPAEMIVTAAVGVTVIGLRTFGPAIGRYRDTYVEYVVTDFLTLRALNDDQSSSSNN